MTERTDLDRLQLVLTANATTSGLGGLVGLLGAGVVSDRLGIDHVGLTAAVSAGLVLFAAGVAHAASTAERAVRWTPLVCLADFTWVAATAAVVAAGVLSTAGTVVAVLVGLAVLDFGVLQAALRRRVVRPTTEHADQLDVTT